MATMLAMCQQASAEMGLAVPTAVAANTATDVVQTLALLNAVGYELNRRHQWQGLTKEYRFTTQYLSTTGTWTTSAATVTGIPTTAALAAGTWSVIGAGIPTDTYIQSVDSGTQVTLTQTPNVAGAAATIYFAQTKYAFPSDYDRLVDDTDWDKTKHWQALGPLTGQQWQYLKSGYIATGPRVRFRPLGGYFQTFPPMTSNEYMGFEYVSNKWVLATTDTVTPSKAAFTVDTDTSIYPDRLLVLGLKVKYFGIKGFAIGDAKTPGTLMYDYIGELDRAKAMDAGSPKLSMAPRPSSILIQPEQIPDTGYGS